MYIKRIDINKYRHLENVKLGPFSSPSVSSEMVVLAGPNGGGKSSILELISSALSNAWSLTWQMNRSQPTSSFEVQLGLLPQEIKLISDYQPVNEAEEEGLDVLMSKKYYCRGFNYPEGEHANNSKVQNAMHQIIQKVLKQKNHSSLGFHLGSDRVYEKEQFQNNNIFQYPQFTSYDYIWSYAYQNPSNQYKDMFQFLVTWRFHYYKRLGQYHHFNKKETSIEEEPIDEYGMILEKVFSGYQFYDKEEASPTDLFIKTPSGDIIPFSDLSSGEKEVFFTLCFFQRHNVENATISIDEPELHLHPSLARQLIRTIQDIKSGNQIWLATHNSEILDEAGREKIWFIKRSQETNLAEVIHSVDEKDSLQALRDLFGYSGYIGLAKKMVFLEGDNSSLDRRMFNRLFPQFSRDLKFIPASGCSQLERINSAILTLLESNLGYCEFFLIRDKDYMDDEMVTAQKEKGKEKIIILNRHEIENYLLNFDIIAKVQTEIFSKPITSEEVREKFHIIAKKISGQVLRDMVTYRMFYYINANNLSIGKCFQNDEMMDENGEWIGGKTTQLLEKFQEKSSSTSNEVSSLLEKDNFQRFYEECKKEIKESLNSDRWIDLFPGKELLQLYSKENEIGKSNNPIFINSIIREYSSQKEKINSDLLKYIEDIMAYP